ncbi:unnamed protein product [Linum trigynum]|uniref:Uncharacterized protein n=1 Tax=Linum trigynum TaxID=586398 RepID=A0AAV2DES3_9ROSI
MDKHSLRQHSLNTAPPLPPSPSSSGGPAFFLHLYSATSIKERERERQKSEKYRKLLSTVYKPPRFRHRHHHPSHQVRPLPLPDFRRFISVSPSRILAHSFSFLNLFSFLPHSSIPQSLRRTDNRA